MLQLSGIRSASDRTLDDLKEVRHLLEEALVRLDREIAELRQDAEQLPARAAPSRVAAVPTRGAMASIGPRRGRDDDLGEER